MRSLPSHSRPESHSRIGWKACSWATSATASFMAYHFHDLSPYVLIGNPLTLTIIEFFAVPGALLGAALYPLGLDAPVWLYVGLGIRFISVLPQLTPATGLGAAAVAAYAAREGMDVDAYLERSGPALTPKQAGEAFLALASDPGHAGAYLLTAAGLSPVP